MIESLGRREHAFALELSGLNVSGSGAGYCESRQLQSVAPAATAGNASEVGLGRIELLALHSAHQLM